MAVPSIVALIALQLSWFHVLVHLTEVGLPRTGIAANTTTLEHRKNQPRSLERLWQPQTASSSPAR